MLQRRALLKTRTPAYVLDEHYLRMRAERFLAAFKGAKVFYAFKCNDLPHLIKTLKSEGIHADVASGFELRLALKLGFREIIYTAPAKEDEDLRLALKYADRVIINIDNRFELEQIKRLKPRRMRVSIRLCPDEKTWAKFGVNTKEGGLLARAILKTRGLIWSGVHAHASWNATPKQHVKNLRGIARFLKQFTKQEKKHLRFVDLGGGFLPEGTNERKGKRVAVEKVDSIEQFARVMCSEHKRLLPKLQLWLEPGRWLVTHSTTILTTVCAIKRTGIVVDSGMNLIGSMDFLHKQVPIVNLSCPSEKVQESTIYGPLCDPDDLWGYKYAGEKARVDDVLAILNCGAYTFSTAWRWQRPTAAYYVLRNNKLHLVKKQETFDDRYRGCRF